SRATFDRPDPGSPVRAAADDQGDDDDRDRQAEEPGDRGVTDPARRGVRIDVHKPSPGLRGSYFFSSTLTVTSIADELPPPSGVAVTWTLCSPTVQSFSASIVSIASALSAASTVFADSSVFNPLGGTASNFTDRLNSDPRSSVNLTV